MDKHIQSIMPLIDLLLVEDSPSDAGLMRRILRKDTAVKHVEWVKDGEEALQYICDWKGKRLDLATGEVLLSGHWPRLILMDIKMPKFTGLEVLKILKADQRTNSIPIVIYSSSDQSSDLEEAYRNGANAYLKKPEEYTHMKRMIESVTNFWLSNNLVKYHN